MTCCLTETHSIPGFILLAILAVAAPTVIWCVTYFLPLIVMKLLGPQDLKKKYQAQWALVTGGSSGIGRAIVDRLALQGLNVCVVSIDDDLLKNTVKELKAAFPKQVRSRGGKEGRMEGGQGIDSCRIKKKQRETSVFICADIDSHFFPPSRRQHKPQQEFRAVGALFSPGQAYLPKIITATKDIDIQIIFNNAG